MSLTAVLAATLLTASASIVPQAPATPPPPPSSPPPPACESAAHRQFDFWLGEWIVSRPDTGAEVGRSTITAVSAGCALHEHWRGGSGYTGQSLNAYDARRQAWTQFWIGGDGVVLRLEGGLQDGAMVLAGDLPKASGEGLQRQRITWTPAEDGSVTQHWQVSDDDGATWTTSFLGLYRRAP
jgi:hypothetical protein